MRIAGSSLTITASSLVTDANLADPDNDSISLTALGTPAVSGATATIMSGSIVYTPAASNGDVNDSFSYTVADQFGGAVQGTINITVTNAVAPMLHLGRNSNGSMNLSFTGTPNATYVLQRATGSQGPWTDIYTNAPAHGLFQYTDLTPPQPAAFYRARLSN